MSLKKRKEFKYILLLNLIVGVHNIINFSINGYTSALIIGIINIGVWCFLRDMKLIPIIIRRFEKWKLLTFPWWFTFW